MILGRSLEPFLQPGVPPVLIVEGPRMSGKTVLARELVAHGTYQSYQNLADPALRGIAAYDLPGWLASLPANTVLDEAQLLPELPLHIKFLVDEPGSSRHYLLTGSASLGRTGLGGSDPLTGRVRRWQLRPFTAAEFAGRPQRTATLLDDLFDQSVIEPGEYPPFDVAQAVATGGFPPLALGGLTGAAADRWVRDMTLGLLTDKVLPDDRFDAGLAGRVLDACLHNPGGVLNIATLAQRLGIDPRTVDRYLDVLQRRFLVQFLPNLAANPLRQSRLHAKVHAVDTAFAAESLRRADAHALATPEVAGKLLETWVVNQIVPGLELGRWPVRAYYWRTPKGDREVDLVLVDDTGRTIGIEVKRAGQVGIDDAKGLLALAKNRPLTAAYVLYTGSAVIRLAQNCWALPVAALV